MVEAFRKSEEPLETFRDGVAVVEMLMALYRSAETGSIVHLPDETLETYVPPVARVEGACPCPLSNHTSKYEPIWEHFEALLPERKKTDHPFGSHRSRIPDREWCSRSSLELIRRRHPIKESP